jgi:excisionase family DNA binding protein
MIKEELLTKKELQEYLKVSHGTIDRLMKEIPYIKLGRRVLFKKSDIDKFLEYKKVN